MNKSKKKNLRMSATPVATPVMRPNAAGIDIGATEIYVAVPSDRAAQPVRCFQTFTQDLNELAGWLEQCGIETVAMESTGVYWIPLFQILEARGLEVCLVNARHVHNVPGRKTDVSDCQWLQYLHSVGLLRASFRPPEQVCVVRSLLRHREAMVQIACTHVQHMQKALSQMNLHLHHVISDITGKTGMAILDAILQGQRDPQRLAELRDSRIQATPETVAKSLVGDYRPEHIFTLRQSLGCYRHYQQIVAECEQEIAAVLAHFDSQIGPDDPPLPPANKTSRKVDQSRRQEHYRILGVDLTQVPGINSQTVETVLSEVGPDFCKFSSMSAFASWNGLCPSPDKSGGKVLRSKTRKVKSRLAKALRLAAQSLHHSQSALGAFYRRMRAKLGAPKAITAAAHKLARIIFHLVTTKQAYDESIYARAQAAYDRRMRARLGKQAKALGFKLVPINA